MQIVQQIAQGVARLIVLQGFEIRLKFIISETAVEFWDHSLLHYCIKSDVLIPSGQIYPFLLPLFLWFKLAGTQKTDFGISTKNWPNIIIWNDFSKSQTIITEFLGQKYKHVEDWMRMVLVLQYLARNQLISS